MRAISMVSSGFVAACIAASACGPRERVPAAHQPSASRTPPRAPAGAVVDEDERSATQPPSEERTAWATITRSPWPAVPPSGGPSHRFLESVCAAEDAALVRVATAIANDRARGVPAPEPDALSARLRAAGEPHVRPKLVVLSTRRALDHATLEREIAARARRSDDATTPTRCGVAFASTQEGGEVVVLIQVDAFADLTPLPTRARTGEWLTFEARIHAPPLGAKVIVMGPRGAPRTAQTSLDARTGIARARFVLDEPGAFTVQLLVDLAEGPRPLLEARVFADVMPTEPGEEPMAPGEDAAGETNDAAALVRMIRALRSTERLPQLSAHARLDALAQAHAERMRDARAVHHDMGDGDFRERFAADGTLVARALGENVAHAKNVTLAHRALHASPSHRMNLMRADYTHIGIGIAHAEDGSVYVCEAFASATPAALDR